MIQIRLMRSISRNASFQIKLIFLYDCAVHTDHSIFLHFFTFLIATDLRLIVGGQKAPVQLEN